MGKIPTRTYFIAFLITAALFSTALYASTYFNNQRIAGIASIEDRISIDILSLETQFDLLAELSCAEISENSVLSSELNSLARRLSYTEGQLGAENQEVIRLKRQYTLLQIKDFLLMKKVSDKCALDPVFILYFYSNEGDCEDCTREGYVLTDLAETYPQLRIYSFDYNLDLSALKTLVSINDIKPELPALVLNDTVYYGYHDQEAIREILPELADLATSTEETSE
ncbi:hypothetical protein COU17_01010 [Candidatus Kaiserbacteria bacterium CG10_big_fil_rev_8_21_14_0_10_49_17]|uniref:Thioredoxin-like fold domain-containing protein n=1 Tax=Candidatus Kaiserbacteria bacterium CG10_big_fil_rev_8_21_14_0_10_49_17 TaxID=1974609 RepID=A0A2M6WEZ1_9BACT|nr:MAG: hypothetical protein COU17_01010 [Candidatus Kaiserbacteria bacterium CG10_big_fil_rev_8_21_14_0_10_49_17]